MEAWSFLKGTWAVAKIPPNCSAQVLQELEQVQSSFVEHHWRLYCSPRTIPAEHKAACLAVWAKRIGALDLRARLQGPATFLGVSGADGKVVGYVSFATRRASKDNPDHVRIYHLAVLGSLQFKRLGVGKALFEAAVDFAKRFHPAFCRQFRLAALDRNKKVRDWYGRLGFKGPPVSRDKEALNFPHAGYRCEIAFKQLTLDLPDLPDAVTGVAAPPSPAQMPSKPVCSTPLPAPRQQDGAKLQPPQPLGGSDARKRQRESDASPQRAATPETPPARRRRQNGKQSDPSYPPTPLAKVPAKRRVDAAVSEGCAPKKRRCSEGQEQEAGSRDGDPSLLTVPPPKGKGKPEPVGPKPASPAKLPAVSKTGGKQNAKAVPASKGKSGRPPPKKASPPKKVIDSKKKGRSQGGGRKPRGQGRGRS